MTQAKETVETIRPTIALSALVTTKVDKANTINGYCDCVSIQMIPDVRNTAYKEARDYLLNSYVAKNGRNDMAKKKPVNLDLIVDDNSGERKYYIGCQIQIVDDEPVYESVEIQPTDAEQAVIELALKKIA